MFRLLSALQLAGECAIVVALVCLAGCSTRPAPILGVPSSIAAPSDPFVAAVQRFIDATGKFTQADLTWALNDATAKGDVVAVPCWTFLIQVQAKLPGIGGSLPPLGLASALQTIRDGVTITSGVPAPFQAACGSLILDTQVRLAALVGAGVAGISSMGIAGPAIGATNASIAAAINAIRVP